MYMEQSHPEQKRSKKKTRSSREKTKKSKHQDYSVSCSDEDSVSTSSVSCSSPGDDNRSKKRGRSRDRKSRKDKKKSKRSSLVSESSGDDDFPRATKLKRSKKNQSSDRKKQHVKRRRRDHSVSCSRSSPSRSGSVCEPSDDIEKKDEKVELKGRKGREKVKERSGREMTSRHMSKSCSPCSSRSEERVLEKNSPKRLKSVIVVTKEREVIEELESNRDGGHKDEIVFDYDDYPSKSNDSTDGVSGRDTVPNLHDVSSEKRSLDEPNRESVVSDFKTLEVLGVQRQVIEGSGVIIPSYVRLVDGPAIGNRNEVCTSNVGSNHNDLEAILRQKALENLLKRQGKLSTKISVNKKDELDEVKKPSIAQAQPVHQPHEGNILSAKNVGKVVDDAKKATTNLPGPSVDTGPSKDNDTHLLRMKLDTVPPEETGKPPSDFVISRPKVSLSMSRKEFLGVKNTWKRQLIPQESSQRTPLAPRELIVKDSKQMSSLEYSQSKILAPQESISKDCTRDSASPKFDSKGRSENVDAFAFTDPSTSGGQCANDKTNEADEETQFQKKTMSVMRGGEMVQVSYKVYIPKKTPALARRKLKR